MRFKVYLQWESPDNTVNTECVERNASFSKALLCAENDARQFHGGQNVALIMDKRSSTPDEITYKVIVNGREDTTEWYVLSKEYL